VGTASEKLGAKSATPKHMRKIHLSRRQFVKRAGAAIAVPFILPSHIWSAEVKPNDRIVLGSIGLGTQGRGLMGGFLGKKETQTVAVCDVDTNRRENAKKTVEEFYAKKTEQGYKGCTGYNDFRELLARKDIDAVVIATPDHWHTLIGIAATKAGKDIYCEKPLTESIEEARALVAAVRTNWCETDALARLRRSLWRWVGRGSRAICLEKPMSPDWIGICGLDLRRCVLTTQSSALVECTNIFQTGEIIANMAVEW